MSTRATSILLAGAMGLAMSVFAAGTDAEHWSVGKLEYQAHCAACHGNSGKGGGPMSPLLMYSAPDLTTYAARNGGVLPRQLAWQTIDGRPYVGDDVLTRQMPTWGIEFREEALSEPEPVLYPEQQVSHRIATLIDYLETLQAK